MKEVGGEKAEGNGKWTSAMIRGADWAPTRAHSRWMTLIWEIAECMLEPGPRYRRSHQTDDCTPDKHPPPPHSPIHPPTNHMCEYTHRKEQIAEFVTFTPPPNLTVNFTSTMSTHTQVCFNIS